VRASSVYPAYNLVLSYLDGAVPLRLLCAGEVQALDELPPFNTTYATLCQPIGLRPVPVTFSRPIKRFND
jgi:hypothetical protein